MSILNSGMLSKINKNTTEKLYSMNERTNIETGATWESEVITVDTNSIEIYIEGDTINPSIVSIRYMHTVYSESVPNIVELGTLESGTLKVKIPDIPNKSFKILIENKEGRSRGFNFLNIYRVNTIIIIDTPAELPIKQIPILQMRLSIPIGEEQKAIEIPEGNPFKLEGNGRLRIDNFAFIYFGIACITHGNNDYSLKSWFLLNNRPMSEPWDDTLKSTERYSFTDWIEVKGDEIALYFQNLSEDKDFDGYITIMGMV